jgi:exo-beta-1,3-glucanase (GH17 family)
MRRLCSAYGCVVLLCAALSQGCQTRQEDRVTAASQSPPDDNSPSTATTRQFKPYFDGRWIGAGIAYGPHRDGQRPGGESPTREELREDLQLMRQHWQLFRMYSSRGPAETTLEIIRADGLDLKMVLGAWIAPEARYADDGRVLETHAEAAAANRAEIEAAIRLANAYPDVVAAVSVGNETQVFWSAHRVHPETLRRHIREVRSATTCPVTTADDFLFWSDPESRSLAREVDFIMVHIHPMWRGKALNEALSFTRDKLAELAAVHPDRELVIGETGWATRKHSEGEQATLIRGTPGEPQQKRFYDEFVAWTTRERISSFFFEAFDEKWKGGPHPDEVEKHWGLYNSDRTPKLALREARG